MASNFKLISFAADTADTAARIAAAMAKVKPATNGPIVLDTKVYERKVVPTDKSIKPFIKHICQVLGTPSAIAHADTLASFTGVDYIYCDAPDSAFRTSVVMTDTTDCLLTFSEEESPASE